MITMLTAMIDTGVSYKTLLFVSWQSPCCVLICFHATTMCLLVACKLAEMQPLPMSVTAKKHASHAVAKHKKA